MAPEIVDLVSDDEELDVPSSSSSNRHRKPPNPFSNPTTSTSPSKPPHQTINPTLLTRTKPVPLPSEPPSYSHSHSHSPSTSSHTERNTPPTNDLHQPTLPTSPLFFPSPSLEATHNSSTPTRKDKGKGRADPIPEIDLSQDTDGEGDENNAPPQQEARDPIWDYANGEFTEEDALRQAIALSLQEVEVEGSSTMLQLLRGGGGNGVARTGGEGTARDEEVKPLPDWHSSPRKSVPTNGIIKTPLANEPQESLSAPVTSTSTTLPTVTQSSSKQTSDVEPLKPASNFSLAGLNRAQMEAERLARLKRKHSESQLGDVEAPIAKVAKVHQSSREKTVSPPPLKRPMRHALPARESVQISTTPATLKAPLDTATSRPTTNTRPSNPPPPPLLTPTSTDPPPPTPTLYPDSIVLQTYIPGYSAHRTITFPTLISPASHLESALLSSFIWNFDWLLPHFDTRRTKFQLVMHAKSPMEREAIRHDWQGVPNVRVTLPLVEGNMNCMHSKLMGLFYKAAEGSGERCRIVVPTANLVEFDWGVGGFMENTVWIIDLPLKEMGQTVGVGGKKNSGTLFEKSLVQFLKAQTVPEDVLQKLDRFDFSKTERYGFVHSIGGTHQGQQAWGTTGVCGLGKTISNLGLGTKNPISMDYVTSSVGSLNADFMSSIYLAAQGDDGRSAYNRRINKLPPASHVKWQGSFRLYFPSENTVRTSEAGLGRAGTICFSSKWWENPNFPKSNMRDCVSVRNGLLMHNKVSSPSSS